MTSMTVPEPTETNACLAIPELARQLEVGDIVFVRIDFLPFRKIARDTGSWTNHVGIVIDTSGKEPVVAESKVPFSAATPLSKFIKRSEKNRVAVGRLNTPPTPQQYPLIKAAAMKRLGIFYDAGFNLTSRRQFCSRFVHEVIKEALGQHIGTVEDLKALFTANPDADLRFWRIWYFGRIPWERKTITPVSLLESPEIHVIFDGYAVPENARKPSSGTFQDISLMRD